MSLRPFDFPSLDVVRRASRCVLAGIAMTACLAMPAVAGNAQEDVLAAQAEFGRVQVEKDVESFSNLLEANFKLVLPDGKIITRDRLLDDLRTWWRPQKIEYSPIDVRMIDNTVIIIGNAEYLWYNDNNVIEKTTELYTDVWVIRNDRWIKWSSHTSCLSGRCS